MSQTRKQMRRRENRRLSVLGIASFVLGLFAVIHPNLPYPAFTTTALALVSLAFGILGAARSRRMQGLAIIGIVLSLVYLLAVFVSVIGR
ncbi:hypothetical protein BPY_21810 [Bifidobacterium psychraerophilum]|jgi:uncharacterized membrane protein HdeD (DUF308 family)|uniref:hypothetical protein n=1 Tax=Bifidobacterium psychraerophilum TaxID=218140 RepID=UPI0023F1E5B7|nr:hypothetical protein [Bifidobacterium psychraerophilum]MCI1660385.1 hypothetical protein [Bifidobacterium psychraerophilum]MCI1804138.1 hypothetical protein [Bifidobacterium psychraerophilum]MCI2176502.1 hypothetical protein [Bifidobacterium psychraerophilum]MCI2182018.1 hypothetical protein [Bifidobacterium psychraerophilum]